MLQFLSLVFHFCGIQKICSADNSNCNICHTMIMPVSHIYTHRQTQTQTQTHTHTHTHTHRQTVSGSGISWAICVSTSLQTDNHTGTSPLSFFTGWMPFLPPNQQRQSTEGKPGVINEGILYIPMP